MSQGNVEDFLRAAKVGDYVEAGRRAERIGYPRTALRFYALGESDGDVGRMLMQYPQFCKDLSPELQARNYVALFEQTADIKYLTALEDMIKEYSEKEL